MSINKDLENSINEIVKELESVQNKAKRLYREVDKKDINDGGYCAGGHDHINAAIGDLVWAKHVIDERN